MGQAWVPPPWPGLARPLAGYLRGRCAVPRSCQPALPCPSHLAVPVRLAIPIRFSLADGVALALRL